MIIATNDNWNDKIEEENVYVDFYVYNSFVHWYPLDTHLTKLNMSITEAAIATRQRRERDDFYERKK